MRMATWQRCPCTPTWRAAAAAAPSSQHAPLHAAVSIRHGRASCVIARAVTEDVLDTIAWPEGARPKRGGITKAALTKLRVPELKSELSKRSQDVTGNKAELVERLLASLSEPTNALPPQAAAMEEQPVAGPGPSSEAAAAAEALAAHATGRSSGRTTRLNGAAKIARPGATQHAGGADHAEAGEAISRLTAAAHGDGLPSAASAVHNGRSAGEQLHLNGAASLAPVQAAVDAGIIRPFFAAGGDDSGMEGGDRQPTHGTAARHRQQRHGTDSGAAVPAAEAAAESNGTVPSDVAVPSEAEVLAALGLDAASLPPFSGTGTRGTVFTDQELGVKDGWERAMVLSSNRSQMLLTFLGTSAGMGNPGCNAPSIALVRANDAWLFDVGEDTQRQLFKANHLKPSKMVRIFVSSRSPERMLGLPGLICTLSSAREKGHEVADIPIHIYGPSGTAEFLASMFQVSDTFIECPVLVHEFILGPVDPEDVEPSLFNSRAKIYRSLLPPDQLNPDGWINAGLDKFMPTQGRAKREKGLRASGGVMAYDARAGFTPPPLPSPGSPDADVAPGDMTWTLKMDVVAKVTCALVSDGGAAGDVPAWGFVVQEASRYGNLSLQRAQALKVNNANVYQTLKAGHPAPNDDGILIPASLVVSPEKPGRRLAVVPQPCTSPALERLLSGVDVLVAGFRVQGAADVAARVGAWNVLVSGLDAEQLQAQEGPPHSDGEAAPSAHLNGAGLGVGSSNVLAAREGVAGGEARSLDSSSDVQRLVEPVQAVLPLGGRAIAVQDLLSVIVSKHEGSDPVPDLPAVIEECVTAALNMQTPKMTAAEKAAQQPRQRHMTRRR